MAVRRESAPRRNRSSLITAQPVEFGVAGVVIVVEGEAVAAVEPVQRVTPRSCAGRSVIIEAPLITVSLSRLVARRRLSSLPDRPLTGPSERGVRFGLIPEGHRRQVILERQVPSAAAPAQRLNGHPQVRSEPYGVGDVPPVQSEALAGLIQPVGRITCTRPEYGVVNSSYRFFSLFSKLYEPQK